MPEIIPNYHPILVHFTIALLSISVVFYVIRLLLPVNHRWREQWLNMANWSLWTGCLFAIATAFAGWIAYNSVAHDGPSHIAMTVHRNWALPTATLFLLLGLSSINLARKRMQPGFKFLSVSIIAAILLMVTGWLGAEVVYRYGLGVMSLPQVEEGESGHNHNHNHNHNHAVEEGGTGGHTHSHGSEIDSTNNDGHHHSHELIADKKNNITQPDGHNHTH